MSDFTTAFNFGNEAFGVSCAETFEVVSGTGSVPGTYTAISIDDLSAEQSVTPGGKRADNTLIIFADRAVVAAAGITEDAGIKIIARGKRLRINTVSDDEDSAIILGCGTAGIKL